MNYDIEQHTEKIWKKRRARKLWHRVVSVLACITVFCTTYALVIPAITMTDEFYCGYEEHPEHTDECYEFVPVCGYADSAETIPDAEPICGQDEGEHIHSDSCYLERRELACEEDEHIHSDACYETQQVADMDGNIVDELVLTCQIPEHVHGDSCYVTWQELICSDEGHTHSSDCYPTDSTDDETHQHTEECYEKQLICEKELHTHTLQCSSDPEVDVEDSAIWERTFANVILTGNWNEDVLAIAETQLGYNESERNYLVDEDGITLHGYTRYGAWYGEPYGDWSTMFVSFCISYAGVPESVLPRAQFCGSWADGLSLTRPENFHAAGTYQPQRGDIVFFDRDGNGYADHVGIVREYNDAESSLSTIEGDLSGQVSASFYQTGNTGILGYFSLMQSTAETSPDENGISYAELTDMLDELERMIQSDAFALVQADVDLLPDEIDGTLIDVQGFYRKVAIIEQAIETAHDTASIAEEEYAELRTRLSGICETFELTASLAANASGGVSVNGLDVVPAPDYIGTIPSPGNYWQITKEAYGGREQSNKTAIDGDGDGKADVYIQKNVVPTNTENEFLVFLSMDKKMTMTTFFDNSTFGLTSSKGYNPGDQGSGKVKGNNTLIGAHGETGTHAYFIRLAIYQHKGDSTPIYKYVDTRYGSSPNCSNGSFFMVFPGNNNFIILQTGVTLKTDGNGQGSTAEADVYLDDIKTDFSFFETKFDQVSDIMGDHIEFLNVVKSDGSASFDSETNTLIWTPVNNAAVVSPIQTGSPVTGWENNICQLVYRVRLRTEDEGFNSCAEHLDNKQASIDAGESYAVNRNAMLQYHFEPISGATGSASGSMTAAYPVPEVRGTLYDLRFSKVNEYGRELSGAVFGLFNEDGITPVLDSDGNAWTIATVAGELSGFVDLPSGTYVLKELKPPVYYNAGLESSWTIRLCYTDDQAMSTLKLDEIDGQNLRYKERDNANGCWEIVNQRGDLSYKINLLKLGRSNDGTERPLSNVEFSVSNPDGGELLIQNTDENGVLSIERQFAPGIEYVITELAPPDGYNSLPVPIRFKVIDDKKTDTVTAELVNEAELAGSVTIQIGADENGDVILALKVYNNAGYELPETGGIGTAPFTLCGLAVLLGGVSIATIRLKRRRERRGI